MSTSTPRETSKTRPRRVLPSLPEGGEEVRRTSSGGGGNGERLPSQSSIKEASTRLSLSPLGMTLRREFSSSSAVAVEETDGEDSSVMVAVRVRPFSKREQRLGARQVVRMHGNETIITSGEGVVHRFHYDHCFWSFDHTQSEHADQSTVYFSLAQPLLDRSFEGFNTCLFAYGQTGSGKSYCIMGEGEEQGVVPQFCRELFNRVDNTLAQMSFKIQVSYYEIYNEKIYDLLASTSSKSKTKLRVREHPVLGPYVEDLSTYVAVSYKDIEHWINLGNRFRATAATGMNDRSSRSHSVFTIMLTQTSVLEGNEHSKVSRINLIDLAGSERSSVAQTSGERLKEGASINRSLHTLGKVISLLSEKSTGKRKKVFIPYRDSTLTWLLKESLGGNSKTAMIATISPADLHHDESLSTLRYAHQARTIVNVARINEDPNARIIRDLRSEIQQLRALMGTHVDPSSSLLEIRELREKLRASEKLLEESSRSWQERLSETEKRKKEELEMLQRKGTLMIDNRMPNLVNLNEDPQLSEMLLYILKEGVSTVGRAFSHDIQLAGALVAEDHCSIVHQNGSVEIRPSGSPDAQTFVNGRVIDDVTTLHHGDRVVFGGEHFFRFNHPLEVERTGSCSQGQQGFEFAKNELVRAQTEKIEAELEQKRLAEREELMRELQEMKEKAQDEMDQQREDYEIRLRELEMEMEGKSQELSAFLQTREEAESRIGQLQQKNQQLEQETVAQRHLIQLEKLKTEKEYTDMKEQRTKLMTELEKEKQKLQEDIHQLHRNKLMREKVPHRESIAAPRSASGEATLLKGTELVRLSMMLQEATIISKHLNKPLIFSREETFNSESREPMVCVRVQNTQLGQFTCWDLEKFESRLEQMRELYQSHTQLSSSSSSTSSLEAAESVMFAGSDDVDPFHDPADTWIRDSLSTPQSSPHHHLVRSFSALSSGSTPASSVLSPSRRILDLTSSIPRNYQEMMSWSKGASPAVGSFLSRPHPLSLSQSLPRLCHDRVARILSLKEDSWGEHHTVFHRGLECVLQMKRAATDLVAAFSSHSPTPDLNVPFSETTDARTHTLLLYVSLERLVELAHTLLTQSQMMEDLTGSGRGLEVGGGQSLMQDTCKQLMNALSHQTALYCNRLFTNIDRDTPAAEETNSTDPVSDSGHDLQESLDHVISLLGRLSLGWWVQEKQLVERLQLKPTGASWLAGDSLDSCVAKEPYTGLAPSFYRGQSEWSTLSIENSCYLIQNCLSTLQPSLKSPTQSRGSELVTTVARLVSTVREFLQRLAEMQSEVWGTEYLNSEPPEDLQRIIPSVPHVVDMLLHLQQVEGAVSSLSSETIAAVSSPTLPPSSPHPLASLSSSNRQLGSVCNQMAAAAQAVLRSSTSNSTPELMAEVQSLTQNTGRAVKSLSILLKSGPAPQGRLGSAAQQQSLGTKSGGPVNNAHQNSPSTPQGMQENGAQAPNHFSPTSVQSTSSQEDPYLEADDDYV